MKRQGLRRQELCAGNATKPRAKGVSLHESQNVERTFVRDESQSGHSTAYPSSADYLGQGSIAVASDALTFSGEPAPSIMDHLLAMGAAPSSSDGSSSESESGHMFRGTQRLGVGATLKTKSVSPKKGGLGSTHKRGGLESTPSIMDVLEAQKLATEVCRGGETLDEEGGRPDYFEAGFEGEWNDFAPRSVRLRARQVPVGEDFNSDDDKDLEANLDASVHAVCRELAEFTGTAETNPDIGFHITMGAPLLWCGCCSAPSLLPLLHGRGRESARINANNVTEYSATLLVTWTVTVLPMVAYHGITASPAQSKLVYEGRVVALDGHRVHVHMQKPVDACGHGHSCWSLLLCNEE